MARRELDFASDSNLQWRPHPKRRQASRTRYWKRRFACGIVRLRLVAIAVSAATTSAVVATISTATATPTRSARPTVETLTGWTFFTRASLVDRQCAALKVFLVEHGNGFFSVGWRGHFDERKAAGTAGRSILHDIYRKDAASLGKEVLKVVFGRGVSEVAHKQLSCHTVMGWWPSAPRVRERPRLRFQLSPLQTARS
jgi:hypothetical protein